MPWKIFISKGPIPIPKAVPRDDVIRYAREANLPQPEKHKGVTKVNIEYELDYEKRPRLHPTEFSFLNVELRLKVITEIYIANNLSDCEHVITAEHEHDHVRDYRSDSFRKQMKRNKIRANQQLQKIFSNQQWRPMSSYETIEERIITIVVEISNELTKEEGQKRDTQTEYDEMDKKVQKCKDKYYHPVVRGESLKKLARRYYGQQRFWRTISDANKGKIGRDFEIHRGQRLLIPKNPLP